jgi:hypothetical protein
MLTLFFGLAQSGIDYRVCFYQFDLRDCPTNTIPINVSHLTDFNSTIFPDARFFSCFLTTDLPLTFPMLATFLISRPKFSFTGVIGLPVICVDVSRAFKFEFEFLNVALHLSKPSFEADALGFAHSQIRTPPRSPSLR